MSDGCGHADRLDISFSPDCQTFSGCKRTLAVRANATGKLVYFRVDSDAREDGRRYTELKAPIALVPVYRNGRLDNCRQGGTVWSVAVKIGDNASVAERSAGSITIERQAFRLVVSSAEITLGAERSTCTDQGEFFNGSVHFAITLDPSP